MPVFLLIHICLQMARCFWWELCFAHLCVASIQHRAGHVGIYGIVWNQISVAEAWIQTHLPNTITCHQNFLLGNQAASCVISFRRAQDFHVTGEKVKVTQLCPAFCDPMDYTVHGILQAKILEWVAIPFSRGTFPTQDRTQVSCIAGRFFTTEPPEKPKNTGVGSLFLLQRICPT